MVTSADERRRFLEQRRRGLGSSDVAAILGYDPYSTPMDVYLSKVRPVTDADVEASSNDAQRGIDLEPMAAVKYEQHSGLQTREVPTQAHPDHSWALASVDRLAGEKPLALERADHLVEIKCPRGRTYSTWRREGLPQRIQLQVIWQLGIVAVPKAVVWAWCADGWEGTPVEVPPRPQLFDHMLNQAGEWWEAHVAKGIPPQMGPVTPQDLGKLPPKLAVGDTVYLADPVADSKLYTAMEAAARAQVLYKKAERNREATRAALADEMAALDVAEVEGSVRVYYRTQQGNRQLDTQALLADHPDLDLEQYKKRGDDTRPLRVFVLGER